MGEAISRRNLLRAGAAGLAAAASRAAFGNEPADGHIPIVDTHQHLWDLDRIDLPWLANGPDVLQRTYTPDDFRAAAEGLGVAKTVYMEVDVRPDQQVREAELVIELCRRPESLLAGAVIGGSPADPGFETYLKRFEGETSVKGVRSVLHGSRPPGFCLRPEFVDAMRLLGERGLSFDLCLRRTEVADGAKLAGQCPGTTFVLDHCGNIGTEQVDSSDRRVWADGIKAAADHPNVVCKISGVIDKASRPDWATHDLATNVGFCLDTFGEDRVLFGGDWPVCLLGGTYKRWVVSLREVVADRSAEFRRKLFHDNAVRIYRLG